jgi:LysR substrate binding domain-containing protein
VLAATERARAAVAGPGPLRLGTSTGLGGRLPRLLAELERRAPGRPVELVRVPAAARLRQVASGALDAALIRGAHAHPGVRLEPVWTDALVLALPAAHAPAGTEAIALARLAELPLRLPARDANPPLVDLVLAACRAAGFEPRRAPALDEQDLLAAIAAGPPTWTVYYAAQAELVAAAGVAFRAPDPVLAMPTLLALRAGDGLDALLAACRVVA